MHLNAIQYLVKPGRNMEKAMNNAIKQRAVCFVKTPFNYIPKCSFHFQSHHMPRYGN